MAQKRKRSKKWISWVILVVLLVAAGVVVYLVWDNYFNDKKEDKQEERVAGQVDKKENMDKNENASEEKEKDEAEKAVEAKKVEQYEGDNPNAAGELSGAVTYAGVSGGVLMIRVNIDQYLDGGECGLTLSRGGGTIYSSITDIVGGPSTASCAGFDVPLSELGGGVVEININVKSGERSGVIHGEANI